MYYMLSCDDPDQGYLAALDYQRDTVGRNWMTGQRFRDPPPTPIEVMLKMRTRSVIAEMWDVPIALMSKRLHAALLAAGIGNLDVYPARLVDPRSGAVFDEHVAFNLVGTIAAADLAKTRFAKGNTDRIVSADIDALGIDTVAASGALMFRLAESVNGIVVHESVKAVVIAAGIDTLTFTDPQDWTG